MQTLFNVGKVAVFLDAFRGGVEKRKGAGDVPVLVMSLRVQPFDSKLAVAVDDGVGGDSNVRPTLFKLNHPDAKPHIGWVSFVLGCERQNLIVYASRDTDAPSITLRQAKIVSTYARTQKNIDGFAFVFTIAVAVDRGELEYIAGWHRTQRAVTFEESEPLLDMEDDGEDEGTDADQKSRAVIDGRSRPAPMWNDADGSETDAAGAATADGQNDCGTCGGNGYVCTTCGNAIGDCTCQDSDADEQECPDCHVSKPGPFRAAVDAAIDRASGDGQVYVPGDTDASGEIIEGFTGPGFDQSPEPAAPIEPDHVREIGAKRTSHSHAKRAKPTRATTPKPAGKAKAKTKRTK